MNLLLTQNEEHMMYNWMSLVNPGVKCTHLHPDTTCGQQIYSKFSQSIKKGFKFYFILHMISFLIFKVKKIKNFGKFKEEFIRLIKKYVGSLLFMGTLVGGIKTFLCFSEKITRPEPTFKAGVFIWGSLLSSLSIIFQDSNRREQISYFVFVRAFRSAYQFLKKRKYVHLPNQQTSIFVFLFGALAYVYDMDRELIKGNDILSKMWGTY